jgi:predicted small lipoprotein YifL
MAKKLTIALCAAAMMALLGGCGYKAPPYYEKPSVKENSSVAL